MAQPPLRVTVWGENVHEQTDPVVAAIYPDGMHEEIARAIREHAGVPVEVTTTTFDRPGQGLRPELLARTDVLVWWGHVCHGQVEDERARAVQDAVLAGMGLVALHASSLSKPFRSLMGTTCTFRWREGGDREVLWVTQPSHPIARGLPEAIVLDEHEMYGEWFDIPRPDELVFLSSFSGGEVFRSGCCFTRGAGRIFYFSPGHETQPVYHHRWIRKALANAATWAGSTGREAALTRAPIHSPAGWLGGSR